MVWHHFLATKSLFNIIFASIINSVRFKKCVVVRYNNLILKLRSLKSFYLGHNMGFLHNPSYYSSRKWSVYSLTDYTLRYSPLPPWLRGPPVVEYLSSSRRCRADLCTFLKIQMFQYEEFSHFERKLSFVPFPNTRSYGNNTGNSLIVLSKQKPVNYLTIFTGSTIKLVEAYRDEVYEKFIVNQLYSKQSSKFLNWK